MKFFHFGQRGERAGGKNAPPEGKIFSFMGDPFLPAGRGKFFIREENFFVFDASVYVDRMMKNFPPWRNVVFPF